MENRDLYYAMRARQARLEEWTEPRRRVSELPVACAVEAFCNNLSLEMQRREGKIS